MSLQSRHNACRGENPRGTDSTYHTWVGAGNPSSSWGNKSRAIFLGTRSNGTRLSCRSFAANAVRLQLHALAYNLGNFVRRLATPEPIKDWSLTSLKEKLVKIGAKIVSHGRYVAFQMAEVAIPRTCPPTFCG